MLTDDGPRVLEFNARWGDPETQVLVPRLSGDLLDALRRAAAGRLGRRRRWRSSDEACVTVVLAARGYPDAPEPGAVIERRRAGGRASTGRDRLPRRHRRDGRRRRGGRAAAC